MPVGPAGYAAQRAGAVLGAVRRAGFQRRLAARAVLPPGLHLPPGRQPVLRLQPDDAANHARAGSARPGGDAEVDLRS